MTDPSWQQILDAAERHGYAWDGERPWDPDGMMVGVPHPDGSRGVALPLRQFIDEVMMPWRPPGDEIRGGM